MTRRQSALLAARIRWNFGDRDGFRVCLAAARTEPAQRDLTRARLEHTERGAVR